MCLLPALFSYLFSPGLKPAMVSGSLLQLGEAKSRKWEPLHVAWEHLMTRFERAQGINTEDLDTYRLVGAVRD